MKLFARLFATKNKLKVEFCEKNLNRFLTKESFHDFESFLTQKNVDYKEYECQSRCAQCKSKPYALVNGEFVSGDNALDLLNKIKDYE